MGCDAVEIVPIWELQMVCCALRSRLEGQRNRQRTEDKSHRMCWHGQRTAGPVACCRHRLSCIACCCNSPIEVQRRRRTAVLEGRGQSRWRRCTPLPFPGPAVETQARAVCIEGAGRPMIRRLVFESEEKRW